MFVDGATACAAAAVAAAAASASAAAASAAAPAAAPAAPAAAGSKSKATQRVWQLSVVSQQVHHACCSQYVHTVTRLEQTAGHPSSCAWHS